MTQDLSFVFALAIFLVFLVAIAERFLRWIE